MVTSFETKLSRNVITIKPLPPTTWLANGNGMSLSSADVPRVYVLNFDGDATAAGVKLATPNPVCLPRMGYPFKEVRHKTYRNQGTHLKMPKRK